MCAWIIQGARNVGRATRAHGDPDRTPNSCDIDSGEFEHNEKHGEGACLRGANNGYVRGRERREGERTKSGPHGPNTVSDGRGVLVGGSKGRIVGRPPGKE